MMVPDLKGERIREVRTMTPVELRRQGWSPDRWMAPPMVVVLESGVTLFASQDEEGNGPGALFGEYQSEGFIVGP
jgi:hypothetical protein